MSDFADQIHIDRIRDALWDGTIFGRAAVMVGAGLSINARQLSPSSPTFPTWRQITNRLVDALHPDDGSGSLDRADARAQAVSTSGSLRLAQEYESAFTRGGLDQFLLDTIPDAQNEPGPLNDQLMGLPWSDVFTTNWDTLLERSAARLPDRKYEFISHLREIPGSSRPRIVKLHGSFPSVRPFIFTEEDFRTYPRRFAPMVNLAQQVMMENVFCLIGFSGDDPNFLAWTGWVRDNLGDSAPRIYLCGVLSLNSAKRDLLRDRNVVPIDLAPLVPADRFPNPADRHATGLKWLLRNFLDGRPPDPRKWPGRTSRPMTEDIADLPKPPPSRVAEPVLEPRTPPEVLDAIKIDEVVDTWATNRKLYPGWLVAPSEVRYTVWDNTKFWFGPIISKLDQATAERGLRWLGELNWRFGLYLTPLFVNLATAITETLNRIYPFTAPEGQPATYIDSHGDQPRLQQAWIELGLTMLRDAREEQDLTKFEEWEVKLKAVSEGHPDLRHRLNYIVDPENWTIG